MSKIKNFIIKNNELILYLIFGALTTAVSILSFWLFIKVNINELIANVLSWILAVTFAFFTNKFLVFKNKNSNKADFLKQFFSFYVSRIATLIIEELIILIFVTILNFNSLVIKTIAQILIIILNYFLSKLFIFKNKKDDLKISSKKGENLWV